MISNWLILWHTKSSQSIHGVICSILTLCKFTTIILICSWALEGFSIARTCRYAIPSCCYIVRVGKINVWGILMIIEASMTIAICWIVDFVIVCWIILIIPLLKSTKERIKRVNARMAPTMVQQQSVLFLNFSSTGRFLKVKTLFLNILNMNPNNFY